MTRIIGGEAGGRRLQVPPAGTRPTSDRAREALFNSLGALLDLDGARVLDLFAGSGAVGLEAVSRGAARAVLVESDPSVAKVVTANIAALQMPGATLIRLPVEQYLRRPADAPFDLVFADPPYALDEAALGAVLAQLVEPGWLAPGAVVVVERSARSPEPQWPTALDELRQKRYGEALLWYRRAP
ncbi:MAG: 16S rRNA (guanine(966)-N(2))-methyltransferase RsmD [Jatrophihabitans sp.]